MSGLVLKTRSTVCLGRRCLSLSAVSAEKQTMPNSIDHATGREADHAQLSFTMPQVEKQIMPNSIDHAIGREADHA
jgi:hypothetical protein